MIELSEIDAYLAGPALGISLALVGLFVGILTGLFGVGGGAIIVPVLKLVLGIPYPLAVGSSLSFMVGTSGAGVARHLRLGNVEPKSMLILAGGSMGGAVLGAMLHGYLKATVAAGSPEQFTLLMHGLFILVLLLMACVVFRGAGARPSGRSLLQHLRLPPYVELPQARLDRVSLFGLCFVGQGIGFLTGLLGVGGGLLFVPVLLLVVGLNTHLAIGTSLGVILFGSIGGTIKHGLLGHVSLWIVLPLLAGSAFGVQLGAWLCVRLRASHLRRYFSVVILFIVAGIVADLCTK